MNKKKFADRITLTAVAAGCIFLTGSAMAVEQTQITLDPAAIQQAIDQAGQNVKTKQASSMSAPAVSMSAPAALQEQMQK
ncbi:MAG: hypothetical protein D3923_19770, partial [Candidatus Electrothrix sp. AR3]|nr:hypothetical protein [Candidatus Electrothrix sp. AR3]